MTGIADVHSSVKFSAASDVESKSAAETSKNGSSETVAKTKSKKDYDQERISEDDTAYVRAMLFLCIFSSFSEIVCLLNHLAQFGVSAKIMFWTEMTLSAATLIVSCLAWRGVDHNKNGLMVPLIALFPPRLTALAIFYFKISSSLPLEQSVFIFAPCLLHGLLMWWAVHRYHRQLAKAEAVRDYLEKQQTVA